MGKNSCPVCAVPRSAIHHDVVDSAGTDGPCRRPHARLTSLRSSLYHNTTLAIAAHTSHWSNASGTVPKATLRKSRLTTATCNSSDNAIAPQSHGLTNRWANALMVPERALKAFNKCAKTSTVKPAVRAVARSCVPSNNPLKHASTGCQHHFCRPGVLRVFKARRGFLWRYFSPRPASRPRP